MNNEIEKQENFKLLKQKVLEKRPTLKNLLHEEGSKNLLEYSNKYTEQISQQPISPRSQEFIDTMAEVVEERFDKIIANSVVEQLKKYYFVSTADHTGPINSSYFVNSNLIISAALLNKNDSILKNNIVLSCAKVSIENISFPRGLYFHNYINGILNNHRLSFFSSHVKPSLVYNLPPYTKENIDQVYINLNKNLVKKEISEELYNKITDLLKDIYDQSDVYKAKTYCEQISKTNFLLWKRFFPENRVQLPNLIYLELEDITSKLIIKNHLQQNTIINKLLFDPQYENFIETYFENIFGSFSKQNSSGTYLFWALPSGAKYNFQLWRNGKFLTSKDGEYKIELTPAAIKEALEKKELIPNLLLSFIVIACYYGVKCLGGFNQINYLTEMKDAYIKMNNDLKNNHDVDICKEVETKEICDGLSVAYLGYNQNTQIALASGLDLVLYNNDDSWERLKNVIKNISLEESISALLPEIYKISYDQKEWDDKLIALTEEEITTISGLNKKIKPCCFI